MMQNETTSHPTTEAVIRQLHEQQVANNRDFRHRIITHVTSRRGITEEDANALLCQAAPEVFAALQVFLLSPTIRPLLDEKDPKAVEQARDAIALVLGEYPPPPAETPLALDPEKRRR
jgi:hypothetical protein